MALAVHAVANATAPPRASAGTLPAALLRFAPMLHGALRASAPMSSSRIGAMSSYHLGWTDADGRPRGGAGGGGKAMRGCLALWAAEQCGGDARDALSVAIAVEWIHNFTLVHDDVQDGDRERRHRPTVWAVWGTSQAINAGDAMHAVAYRALLSGRGRPAARLRAAAAINEGIVAVIEGQCLDLDLEGRVDTPVSTYRRLARAKTGALIGAAIEAGALMGGADRRRAALMRRAGVELGLAFQIRDDWLGTWGDTSVTGKGCGGDIRRRKVTYPVVLGHSRLRGAARREFRRAFERKQGDEDVILELMGAAGVREGLSSELSNHASSALKLAQACGLVAGALDDFRSIVEFAVDRDA